MIALPLLLSRLLACVCLLLQKGKVVGTVIELETQPVGLCVIDKAIIVGCMDHVIHSFHFKGKKNYSIYLPEPITNMELLSLKRMKNVTVSSADVAIVTACLWIHTRRMLLLMPCTVYCGCHVLRCALCALCTGITGGTRQR